MDQIRQLPHPAFTGSAQRQARTVPLAMDLGFAQRTTTILTGHGPKSAGKPVTGGETVPAHTAGAGHHEALLDTPRIGDVAVLIT
ncbi:MULTISPECIES: hypothetical protein [unclassified Streptomyces]|uniref:hypothetical protein n=1 Tax=unclassified Streptomyces TaxID=2593676 RepID=UPI00119EBCDC|nr:hypothetical protein [Streptomyces sp. BK340]TVZ92870.1 hypothetical protein FB157_107172 [Streptomyces sp. BK340]